MFNLQLFGYHKIKDMKNGITRFYFFLDQLQNLLTKASKQKNPALWLYKHNARTPLFMLEGLAKLYSNIHNKKKFQKIKEQFKLLEDAIGQIDYYDALAKEFVKNKKIPATLTKYLQAQSREKIQSLNEILGEKKWLVKDNGRIQKIKKKLAKADWQNAKHEIESIHELYKTTINKILEFLNSKDFRFDDVENDLHESRRMLRWLSIYPQALRGCIQLSKAAGKIPEHLLKYHTEAITTSPFNTLPDAGDLKHFLLFDQSRFLALSWMIAELGNLKDSGLKVEALLEALLQTSATSEKQALSKAYKLSGAKQKKLEQLLAEAGTICKIFCKENNLEELIIGTAVVK